MTNPKQFIEQFRLENYGVDSSGKQRADFGSMSRQLKNAIEQLSKGLYEKEIHFIFELIQNAEDNDYNTAAPELEFRLMSEDPTGTPNSDGCLCVFNNEVGFSLENIESICQIGGSTKKKAAGYIGEKGIGFKSVFLVSERPHIFSNGFQFCFKENDPAIELAYIVPYWIDSPPQSIEKKLSGSCILLPLKSGKKAEIDKELSSIAPETILFLSKLQGIAIELLQSDQLQLIRDHKNDYDVDLLVSDGNQDDKSSSYWLLHEDYVVPDDLDEEKRAEVTERTISIAFPINSLACDGRLFAYLPTEVYSGLPFLVNADFILSASRESIQIDRAWNQWIRDCVADSVIDGICRLAESDNHSFRALSFLPLASELTALPEFLGPICNTVVKTLRERDIVLADDDTLVAPNETRQVTKTLRAIFPLDQRPSTFFDTHYFCHPKLDATLDQLKALGIKKFDVLDLRKCLEDHAWLRSRPESWFQEFLTYLSTLPISRTRWLAKIPFIPTADGRVVAPSDNVFYLSDQSRRRQIEQALNKATLPPVSFVSQPIFDALAADPKRKNWLEQVARIQTFSISSYVADVLLPWTARNVKELTRSSLFGICQIILDNWEELDELARGRLGTKLPLELADNSIVPRSNIKGQELLVPRAYDKKTGWQLFLLEKEDYEHEAILADSYMKLVADKEILESFFDFLGAEKFPDLRDQELPLWGRKPETYSEYISTIHDQFQESSTTVPRIKTWAPPSFFLKEELRQVKKHRSAFLSWLEGMIENRAESLKKGKLSWFYYSSQGRTIPSCLYWYVTNFAWINTTKGLKRPGEAFTPTKGVQELLGNSVPYLQDKISDDLCNFLGIQTEVTNDSIASYLSALSGTADTDLKTLRRLYEHLDRYAEDIEEDFAENALIFIPDSAKGWYSSREVVWQDLSDVFDDMYVGLSTTYEKAGLRKFFVKKLSVSETVGAKELADAWLRLSDEANPNREKVENALTKIMPEILRAAESETKANWWEGFAEEIQVWTLDRVFNAPDVTFAGDDDFLRRKLDDELSFIWKPDSRSHLAMRPLYDALGIKLISEAVSMSLTSSADIEVVENPEILTSMSKRLLSYLVFSQKPDDFADQLEEGPLRHILETREGQSAGLDVKYKIPGMWVDVSDTERVAFLNLESQSLILRTNADNDDWLDEAAEGVSRALWGRSWKKLNDSVRAILGITTDHRYKGQKDKRGWSMPRNLLKEVEALIDELPPIAPPDRASDQPDEGNVDATTPDQVDDIEGHRQHKDLPDESESMSDAKIETQIERQAPGASPSSATRERARSGGARQRKPRSRRNLPTFPPKGRSKSSRTNQEINRHRQSRIVTYVFMGEEEFDTSDPKQLEQKRRNTELGDAAERLVVQAEIDAGRQAEQMSRNYPGYDVKSTDPETGEVRFIEVKATRGPWGERGVGLSATQYNKARERRSAYWLYVVENATADQPTITRICNPAERVTEYRFDQNWRSLVESEVQPREADTAEFATLVDELKSYTDSNECRQIIDLCDKHDIDAPEVGYELMSDDESVIAEAELAWPHAAVAILVGRQSEDSNDFESRGWETYSPNISHDELLTALLPIQDDVD